MITEGMEIMTVTPGVARWNDLEGVVIRRIGAVNDAWLVQLKGFKAGDFRCFRGHELREAGGPW